MNDYQSQASAVFAEIAREGIAALPGLLSTSWADQLDRDLRSEFMAAASCEGGTAPRGWNRFYFEPYPERLSGFLELISQPLLHCLSLQMFGDNYQVVELGCDLPLPGARNQPWHRDFPMPAETRQERRLTSIAVNASSVDTTLDMGPFQIVPGTHFESGSDWDGEMFPPESRAPDYEARMQTRLGQRGTVSVRSGLTVHRGSKSSHRSRIRPVAIVGIVSPEDRAVRLRETHPDDPHCPRLRISREFLEQVPAEVLPYLSYEIVAERSADLPPHFTHHTFEGLKMSEQR